MSLARRLVSQSAVMFGGRLFGAGLVFLMQALIARHWGASVLGEYLLVIAAANLIAVAMPLGFQMVGSYFAAEYRARGERRQLVSFLLRAYAHVALTGTLLMLAGPLLLGFAGLETGLFAAHGLPLAVLSLATAIVYVNGGVLVGLKRPLAGFLADGLVRPMMMLAMFLVIAASGAAPDAGFSGLLWAVALGYLLIAGGQLTLVFRAVSGVADYAAARPAELRRWWRFAAPWVLITLATDFFFDIDLLLLAAILPPDELAIFGVCARIFALVSFGVSAVYAVVLPDMFEREVQADRQGFHRKVGEANMLASLVSLALFALVLIGAPFALLLFGPDFTAGAAPLSILCLGLVIRSVMGPASMVLSIYDHPWASVPAVGLGIAILVLGNWLLVPSLHLVGAALAAVIAIAAWSVGLWLIALRLAGVDVSLRQYFVSRRVA